MYVESQHMSGDGKKERNTEEMLDNKQDKKKKSKFYMVSKCK